MARGKYATAAYYVTAGEVEIVELGEVFGRSRLQSGRRVERTMRAA